MIDLSSLVIEQLPEFPTIISVTLAELSAGPQVAKDAQTQQSRQLVLQQAEASFDPLPFEAASARRFAVVAAAIRNNGRKTRARAFDALIAATALAHDLPLYTRNPRDFDGITQLDVREV